MYSMFSMLSMFSIFQCIQCVRRLRDETPLRLLTFSPLDWLSMVRLESKELESPDNDAVMCIIVLLADLIDPVSGRVFPFYAAGQHSSISAITCQSQFHP